MHHAREPKLAGSEKPGGSVAEKKRASPHASNQARHDRRAHPDGERRDRDQHDDASQPEHAGPREHPARRHKMHTNDETDQAEMNST